MKREEDDDESNRVSKKRRTSSEAPEDLPTVEEDEPLDPESEVVAAKIAADLGHVIEETEADPEGDQWDDLDADDGDDPLMVSEYVLEIFDYLKEVEVSSPSR